MAVKQVQMHFQVVANDGVSADVVVAVDGVQKFLGKLTQTVDDLSGQVTSDMSPFDTVQFDLDIDPVVPTPPDTTPQSISKQFMISVTGGTVALQRTTANYTGHWGGNDADPNKNAYAGTADKFIEQKITSQPIWTSMASGRFDITSNPNGGGTILLLDNESVSYTIEIDSYSNRLNNELDWSFNS